MEMIREYKETLNSSKKKEDEILLFNSATGKYQTMSVISIVLSVLSAFVVHFFFIEFEMFYDFFPYNFEYVQLIFFILMIGNIVVAGVATIFESIGLIKYKTIFNHREMLYDEEMIVKGKKTIRNYSAVTFSLVLHQLLYSIFYFTLESRYFDSFLFQAIFATTIVTSYLLFYYLNKKYSLGDKGDAKYLSFRNMLEKITILLLVVCWIICLVVTIFQSFDTEVIIISILFATMISAIIFILDTILLFIMKRTYNRKEKA